MDFAFSYTAVLYDNQPFRAAGFGIAKLVPTISSNKAQRDADMFQAFAPQGASCLPVICMERHVVNWRGPIVAKQEQVQLTKHRLTFCLVSCNY